MPRNQRKSSAFEIQDLLKSNNLKATQTRIALLEILTAEHGPFTAEQLRTKVSKRKSSKRCDLVTIYRCIEKFEHAGLVDRCDFGDGSMRYEIRSKNHHHHIICRQCQRVEPLFKCAIDEKMIKLPKMGFKNITHRLEFFGICPDCCE